ncbi:MAG: insulinase family protein [Luteitalea sp.]|nr:insulinase family protein [Luteitalea sp.]
MSLFHHRRATRSGLLAVILVCFVVLAGDAAVRPPPLDHEITTLPNGLTVVLHEDHSTPIVNVQIWYHVGSRDERPGRTGFAHLFEHMMFKGTENVTSEAHTSWIASIGGQSNAFTTEDATVFHETVPAQYLPLALWLEADRMASLKVEEQTFRTEREVVKEERRQRVESQPYGRLSEIIYDQAYTRHSYKHPVIGSMADLEAASIEEVRAFHEAYYRPDNATLVLAGDFDPKVARDLIQQYFGRVPKPAKPVVRDIPREPPQTAEKRLTLEEEWPLPVVVVAHHVTFDGNPDSYPLHVAAKILSDGQSSRIYRRLVYKEGSAVTAFGTASLNEDPSLFYAAAIVAPGHEPEEVANALIDELEKLGKEPVSEHVLTRAKNQFARDYIVMRQTVSGKGQQLGHAVVIHNDVTTADGEFDIFQGLTADDVQRVARTYFKSESRTVLTILPKGMRETGANGR